MDDNIYLIWLSQIGSLGLKKQDLLLEYFESAKDIFFAKKNQLTDVRGLSTQNINSILNKQKTEELENIEKILFDKNVKYISKFDDDYPKNLKSIIDPPLGIYVLGNLPDDNFPKISVIGSRKCTEYGKTIAFKFAKDFAKSNVTVVSGFARGIDIQAHLGAVEADGHTIAVLGCGVDVCYPPENKCFVEYILKKGCFISEYFPGTKPHFANFPIRNRIISGMSSATVIIEAEERSGTHITCDQALEQGREVFAVPGNLTSKLSRGTNALISQGANIAISSERILEHLQLANRIEHENRRVTLAGEEKLVYDCIGLEPVDMQEIIFYSKCQLSAINFIVTELELKGYIKRLPGQRYIRSF